MKKLLVLVLLVSAVSIATAQDTVRYPDKWYAYADKGVLVEDTIRGLNSFSQYHPFMDTQYAAVVYPVLNKKHSWLYGIAVTVADSIHNQDIATDYTSIILYSYHGVTLTTVPLVPNYQWTSSLEEPLRANRNNVKQCKFEYEYDQPTANSTIAKCYEFYYEQPIPLTLDEEYYVGISRSCGYYQIVRALDTCNLQHIGILTHIPSNSWLIPSSSGIAISAWGGIFPIVELRCTAPRGLRLCDTGIPTACWSSDTNAEVFQLSVCSSLAEPELGTLATTHDTSYILSGLHPDSAYLVYLRKRCGFISDTVWSDWSGPLVIGDTTGWAGSTGIAEAEATAITLTPNPAADRVTVSAEELESVELIGTDGVVLQRKECRNACTLDLRGLAAGIYMVRVSTPSGTMTKRLVVR